MIFVIAMIGVIAVNSRLVARGVLKPLRLIQGGAEQVGRGDFDHRIGSGKDDEIGDLARAFDAMTVRLQHTRAAADAARKAVHAQANLMAAVFNNMHDGLSIVDADLNIVRVNPAARRLMGLEPGDPLPARWTDITGRYRADRVTPIKPDELQLGRVLRGEPVTHSELFLVNDKHPRGLCLESVSKSIGDDTDMGAALTIWHDVTAARQVEQTLRESEALKRAVIENAMDCIISIDQKGRIIDFNPAAEHTFGYRREDVLGRELAETIFPPHLREAHHRGLAHYLKTGEGPVLGKRVELDAMRADGSEFPVELGITAMRIGEQSLFTAHLRDITERQRAAHEIRQLNETLGLRAAQLESANQELESFCYSVSHDLRAPLRAIDGFSRMLVEQYSPQASPEALRYLARVRANAQQMGTLIDDLLAFSRLGRQQMAPQSINTTDLVQQCVSVLRAGGDGEAVSFTVGQLPACEGDPGLIREVWMNLLSNAFKFSSKCAAPQVEAGTVASEVAGGNPVYFVRDNGAGFDMRYADKLFGVFQRLHAVTEFPGTGVGLALVQRIVQRHGGRIWAEAQPGYGATFFFTLGEHHVQR